MSSRSPVMAFDNGKSSLRGVPRVIMKDYSGRSSSACSNVEVYHYSDSVFHSVYFDCTCRSFSP